MHLLHAETLRLEEYFGENVPPYTILSHRWGDQEVSLRDITRDLEGSKQKHGFQKIKLCAAQTLLDGFRYCWVDTCCIDKNSSAELTEAINSMYEWYKAAKVCYAYMDDVEDLLQKLRPNVALFWDEHFLRSKWWSRGW